MKFDGKRVYNLYECFWINFICKNEVFRAENLSQQQLNLPGLPIKHISFIHYEYATITSTGIHMNDKQFFSLVMLREWRELSN